MREPIEMEIIIDNREHKLIELLNGSKTPIIIEQLTIGDIVIKQNGVGIAVIERKTIADLAASLKDGRYREQKLRLLQEGKSCKRVLYVIEGGFNYNEEGVQSFGVQNKALVTMLMNTMFRDNIHVIFTSNIVDTCDFIRSFAKRACDPLCVWNTPRGDNIDAHQEALIQSKKRANVSCDTIFAMQLCAIPGISNKKVGAIRDSLGVNSIRELIKKIDDAVDGVKLLMSVPGIGKGLAADIVKSL
jgi:ERCC4-type nuclease